MASIDLTRDGTVAVVTINNPGKRNAMTDDMWRQIPAVMREIDGDDDLHATVLTGAGDVFCAGADIAALDELNHAERPINAEMAIAASPKPVIAAIEGPCFGGGVQMAVAADLRVASSEATFSVPPARLGVVYPVSATQRMIHLMGPSVTKEMLYTAERLDAQRALAVGLLNRVVAPGEALATALELAERMAGLSQLTMRASKEIVDGLVARDLSAETAIAWVARAASGPDLLEGKQAFLERRAPRFTWRPD
ncbi:MAG TPA: enoyl-CoA hydratase/isomerase family protein [Tessaracoccus flavescens]|uniref:Enoyl-CoA hydratase/isomerase family protein n=1 Tax=Tessaracoccus flavescens TaxID=399497 RepID=A0A921EN25_9ACTN|nr:enoyl-CoA hydratase/isomerase family protein [Tessaracoccus flavescens]